MARLLCRCPFRAERSQGSRPVVGPRSSSTAEVAGTAEPHRAGGARSPHPGTWPASRGPLRGPLAGSAGVRPLWPPVPWPHSAVAGAPLPGGLAPLGQRPRSPSAREPGDPEPSAGARARARHVGGAGAPRRGRGRGGGGVGARPPVKPRAGKDRNSGRAACC